MPVTDWDGKTDSNILWKTKMPGYSHSSPIVAGDRVFTLAAQDLLAAEHNSLVCVDARNGKILWRRFMDTIPLLPKEEREKARALWDDLCVRVKKARDGGINGKWGMLCGLPQKEHKGLLQELAECSIYVPHYGALIGQTWPSPVSDGTNVYVCTANNYVGCFDRSGKCLWAVCDRDPPALRRAIGRGRDQIGMTSPLLHGDRLIVVGGFAGGKRHRVRVYDKRTGVKMWERPGWQARDMGGTPVVVSLEYLDVVVCPNSWVFRLDDGRLMAGWGIDRAEKQPEFLPRCLHGDQSPVCHGNRVYYVVDGNTGGEKVSHPGVLAIELESVSRDEIKWRILWHDTSKRHGNYNGTRSLVYSKGKMYDIETDSTLRVRDATTGKLLHKFDFKLPDEALPASMNHAPGGYGPVTGYAGTYALAGNHVFLKRNHGRFAVLRVDGKPERVSTPRLYSSWELAGQDRNRDPRYENIGWENGFGFSHLSFSGSRMFVRSFDALYCIGE